LAELGTIVALFADVHAETRSLERALEQCHTSGVETIALLGDLFDRAEEADICAAVLAEWHVTGVYGNHEREIALAAAAGEIPLQVDTIAMLSQLHERIVIDEVCFVHEEERWGHVDPIARMFHRHEANGHHSSARITFAGHTHFRSARDERGHLDVARGTLKLEEHRRYLINPGALAAGQYAIWNRETKIIEFHQIEDIRGGFIRP
jgi:predicted phosphodiesterase